MAPLVWERFGDPPNFVEPFAGSLAVLLARPLPDDGVTRIETVNDKDGFISNFWRAVAHHADWPVNENDLHARHGWLVRQAEGLSVRLEGDPAYFDAKIAGWWCWGMCCWIGSGFCSGNGPWQQVDGLLVRSENDAPGARRKRVHLGNAGVGVNRKRVHLGNAGVGVNRKLVHLGPFSAIQRRSTDALPEWMQALSARLRRVRVACGDWSRVCGPSPTFKHGTTAVFLDPPYSHEERHGDCYREEMSCAAAVREWALEWGDDPLMRVALCGYEGEHDMPGWECVPWNAAGGYGSQGNGQARKNSGRERIWLSPACIRARPLPQLAMSWDLEEALA